MEVSIYAKFPKLKETRDKLNARRDELQALFAEAGPELDMDQVTTIAGDSKAKVEWIAARNDEIDELKADHDRLMKVANAAEFAKSEPLAVEGGDGAGDLAPAATKSLGQLFVESPAFKGYQGGGVGPVAHLDIDIRNTLMTTTAGWAPESTRTGELDLSPERRAPVRRKFSCRRSRRRRQRSSSCVRPRSTTRTSWRKPRPAAYGEAALALTEVTLPVEKIPVFIPVTDEQLEDVEGIGPYIEDRLTLMINKRLDKQILTGTGVTPLLEGTENVGGIQTQALGTDSIPDAIYKLLVNVRDDTDNGGGDADPTVVFIRATKWQTVRLLRTADGIYIWGHPSTPGPDTIWGVPVAQTNAVTATKAVAGDYRDHSNLRVKRGIDIQITNSHSTFFTEGKQAVRADMRVAMVHRRPTAFGELTGL